jgi:hypothetical protein
MGPRVTRVVWDRQGLTSVADLDFAILESSGDCIAYLNGEPVTWDYEDSSRWRATGTAGWEGARGATGWLNTTKTPQHISSVRFKYSHLSP